VNHPFKDAFDRDVSESGSALTTVSVSKLDPGVTISSVLDVDLNATIPYRPLISNSPAPAGGYILTADYLTLPGVDSTDIRYQWMVLHNGVTTDITCGFNNQNGCVYDGLIASLKKVYWTPSPEVNDGFGYEVTFNAISKASGEVIDSDSFLAIFRAVN